MATSSHLHAVLFTKEVCGPCIKTKAFIDDLFEASPGLAGELSILKKENHSALVEAYGLNLYPTLLVVGPNGTELNRFVGGRLIRDVIEAELTTIKEENS